MRRTTTIALVAVVLLSVVPATGTAVASAGAAQSDCAFPYSGTDATGDEVTVEERPDRVAVLQASDAQTMWEIGAREQVVAMPQNVYTGYLNDTDGRTDVANEDGTTKVEAVVGADPDVVIAANVTSTDTIQQLRDAGLTVYHLPFVASLEGIYDQTETIGRVTGNCDGAAEIIEEMQERVRTVEQTVADGESPRALYYSYGYTTGNNSHIGDLIETAGARNIAAAAGITGYGQISSELVVDRDPQWLVLQTGAPGPSGSPYNETTALQQNQTVRVNANYLSQPAPRAVIALETMAQAFHSEAYAEAETQTATPSSATETETEATATATPTPTATVTAALTEPTTTTANGPGFGALPLLVAVGAAALLAGRRKGT